MTRSSREQIIEAARPARIPVHEANRDKLTIAGLDTENFAYRWVNDVEDRLANFQAAWWEFVDQNGNPVGDEDVNGSAGTSSKFSKGVGGGVIAYLMRIPKELWLEDQAAKERDLKEREADMRRNVKSVGDYGRVEISIKDRD